MARILDLDALAPKNAKVKFEGVTYSIKPINVEDTFRIINLSQALQEMEANSVATDEVSNTFDELAEIVFKYIPKLKGKIALGQLFGLANFLTTLSVPETKDLEDNEVTVAQAKKNRKN